MRLALRPPRVPLVMLFTYFAQFWICGFNYWWFISSEEPLFGKGLVQAHLTFNLIGGVTFIFLTSPFLLWPFRYGSQMPKRSRRNAILLCINIVFFFHDFPLWCMEFWTVWRYGWMFVLQGISLFLLSFTTTIGFFCVWLSYAWRVSKILQRYFGSTSFNAVGLAVARANPAGRDAGRI
jgi:hypothetical protein